MVIVTNNMPLNAQCLSRLSTRKIENTTSNHCSYY